MDDYGIEGGCGRTRENVMAYGSILWWVVWLCILGGAFVGGLLWLGEIAS